MAAESPPVGPPVRSWRRVAHTGAVPSPRSGAASAVRPADGAILDPFAPGPIPRPRAVRGAQMRQFSLPAVGQVIGDSLYLYGGYGGNGRLDDFFQYSFRRREWTAIDPQGDPPCARENNGVVVRGRCLYLFGGYNGTTWLNDFHEFDIGAWRGDAPPRPSRRLSRIPFPQDTHKWREIRPKGGSAPAPRFGYVSAVHRDSFIVFGGYDGATWLNDMHEYSFSASPS